MAERQTASGSSELGGGRVLRCVGRGHGCAVSSETAGGAWTVSGLTFVGCESLTAQAIEDGLCLSAASNTVVVTGGTTVAPAITDDCATISTGTVSGTGVAGAIIQLYINGTLESGATATVGSGGEWSITGLTLTSGQARIVNFFPGTQVIFV